ncbi:MAG: SAM-dependent methyltransferase [Tidjanibacter sp.]|jgi:16S rRNA (cytidine1402-2'-O)-methyltransferase|nr:SAM-dependent methyltransferase [Tidjanibacter sp.]
MERQSKYGKIYMLPCPISEGDPYDVLPEANRAVMGAIDYFIVENVRTARRFLSAAKIGRPIEELEFAECSEHTSEMEVAPLLKPILEGRDCGIISEAGLPGVADPGADVVAAAQRLGIEIVPLVGPSSILMALMASGQNGQSFAFNGYLPIKPAERSRAIKNFERRALQENQSQIFIEAPYRNEKLFADMLSVLQPSVRVTVAVDITSPTEFIRTLSVAEWRKAPKPEMHKKPTIFILGR